MSILSKEIKNLNDGESFNFIYKDKEYEFCCYSYSDEKKHYSVRDASSFLGAGMNVEKITKKYISLYDYNLFNVRSTFKLPVNEITFKTQDIPGFEGTLEALDNLSILK
jgi:hypothetical protein